MGFFKNKYNELWAGWKIAIVMAVFFAITLALSIGFSIVYGIMAVARNGQVDSVMLAQELMNSSLFNSIAGIMQNIAIIIPVVLFWKLLDKKPLSDMGFPSVKYGLIDFIYGLVLGAVTISITFVVLLLSGQIIVENGFMNPNFSWTLLLELVLMTFVGFGEEMFSRGYCMSVLRRSNIFIVFIVPNLIFTLLHISNNHFSYIPLINIFLVGILFSLMFEKRGSIWMPIGYHITWNYFQGSIFGLPVSGNSMNGLYTSKLISENIFNGGGFGPEGGLLVTLLMVVSIALFCLMPRKKTAEPAAAEPAPTDLQM